MEKIKELFKNKVFLWSAVGVVAVAAAVIVALVLIGSSTNDPDDGTVPGGDVTYTVEISTNAGMALANVELYIYADNTLADMINIAKTDADGIATFTAPAGTYAVTLKGVPAGYPLEESYPITGEKTEIVLTAELIRDADLSKDRFTLHSVMFDFNVTDTEGNTYVLSELLQQKKAVVLNFWFANCNPCRAEFPFLQEAYESYSEDIALLALTPVDDAQTVAQFRNDQGLTIPMASVDADWEKALGLIAYPTTVVIDRFGNINVMHVGSVPNTELFANMFAYYTSEDYTQQSGLALEDFAAASEEGSQANPLEFGSVTEFEVTVEPGKEVYVDVYKVSGMLLSVQDETVSILYNENTYTPENGVVTFRVEAPDTYTPVKLVFTNTGSETKTYKATLTYPLGTMGNPYQLELGDFTVDVPAGNDQGVYYTYIAQESGELTLKCVSATEGVGYTFTLYNLNTYVYLALDPEGDSDTLTIAVNKGDELQFTAGSLPDENNEYPAAALGFTASFEEKEVDTPHPTESSEPLPTDPPVTDPAPTDPGQTTPAPTDPKPTTPAPTDPKPTTPTPTDPKPTQPQPTDPPATEPEELEYKEMWFGNAYYIGEASTNVRLNAGDVTYFLFTPERSGQYRFETTAGKLAYHGTAYIAIVTDLTETDQVSQRTEKSFVINIKDSNLGASFLISITAPAGTDSGKTTITRVGNAVLSWEDKEYTPYSGTYTPTKFDFTGGTLKYVNITGKASSFVPVLGDDGFYHLNSKTGPLLYLNLTGGAYADQSLNAMLNSNRPIIQGYVRDENGNILGKEQYNDLVQKYIDCSDGGLYPLTADLVRILKTQNDSWYLYLVSEKPSVKKDLAWMCNVCYVE